MLVYNKRYLESLTARAVSGNTVRDDATYHTNLRLLGRRICTLAVGGAQISVTYVGEVPKHTTRFVPQER